MSRKAPRDNVFFLRLTDKEMKLLDTAVEIKFGRVYGYKCKFARQALMLVAKQVVKSEAEKRRGDK